ncbi:2497_t:CDS:2, partial [Entrophospora sp. SA101]
AVSVVPTASTLVIRALKEPPRDCKKEKNVKHAGNITLDEIRSSMTQLSTTDILRIPYNTVQISPNNGTWTLCSEQATKYVSYSLRVVNDSFPITPNYGISRPGQEQPLLLTSKVGVISLVVYSSNTKFISSLSCYRDYVMKCDQNTGAIPIKDSDNYCLVIWNSSVDLQYVNVSLSFNESVFNNNFTSPNKQGGNNVPIDDNNNSLKWKYKSTTGKSPGSKKN